MGSNASSLGSSMGSTRLHRWEAFTILMLVLMDLSWITPTYSLLVGWSLGGSDVTAFLVFGAIYLASCMIASVPRYLDIFIGVIQIALLALLLLGVTWAASELIYFDVSLAPTAVFSRYLINLIRFSIPLKPELILSIFIFFLWRRGFTLANRHIGLGLIRRSFRMGSALLVTVGVFAALFEYNLPYLEAGLFIFTGLQAMGGARFTSLGAMRGSKRVAFKREWVFSLILTALLVAVLSVGFGVFAAGPLAAWLGGLLFAIEGVISSLLKLILTPVIHLFGIILSWLWSLFEPQPEQAPTEVDELGEGLGGPIAEIQRYGIDPEIASLLTTLGTVIGILILAGIVLYAVRRYRKESPLSRLGDEDAISIAGSFSDYLRSMQEKARQVLEGVVSMNPAARLIAAARIRVIYARLLKLGASWGEPRAPAVTPIEYLMILGKVIPAASDELELITDAYLRVRYGEYPESRAEVEAVETAWRIVRSQ